MANVDNDKIRGSVTFSLKAWKGGEIRKGQIVVLENLTRMKAGWRAEKARPLKPDDEAKEKQT